MKILVLGVSGMIGHKIFLTLNKLFPQMVYGTTRTHKNQLCELFQVEAAKIIDGIELSIPQNLLSVLERLNPDVVINCTGITIRKLNQSSVEQVYCLNSLVPKILAFWCESHKSKCIHFSTDCVFDGSKGCYTEKDLPEAKDLYGRSKFLGEINSPNVLVLRSPVIGRELFSKTELLEWFLSQKNKEVTGYENVFYSGITTDKLAKEVAKIIQKFPQLSGVYHISGERISKYELLLHINQVFDLECQLKKSATQVSDKSLVDVKYKNETNFQKETWLEMLKEIYKNNEFYERAQNVLSR